MNVVAMALSQMIGALGVAVTAPVYLSIKTMRHAFLRTVRMQRGVSDIKHHETN